MGVMGVHSLFAQIGCICKPIRSQDSHWKVYLLACPELPIKVVAGPVVVPAHITAPIDKETCIHRCPRHRALGLHIEYTCNCAGPVQSRCMSSSRCCQSAMQIDSIYTSQYHWEESQETEQLAEKHRLLTTACMDALLMLWPYSMS